LATRFIELGHPVHGCGRSAGAIAELQSRWPTPHRFEVVDVVDDRQFLGLGPADNGQSLTVPM
jgi:NADP-dependent 3-hydroxy acid dehydrogenase YdfG